MDEQKLFEEITSKPKWYAGYTSSSNASNIKKRYKEKSLQHTTLIRLFNHFGYKYVGYWQPYNYEVISVDLNLVPLVLPE